MAGDGTSRRPHRPSRARCRNARIRAVGWRTRLVRLPLRSGGFRRRAGRGCLRLADGDDSRTPRDARLRLRRRHHRRGALARARLRVAARRDPAHRPRHRHACRRLDRELRRDPADGRAAANLHGAYGALAPGDAHRSAFDALHHESSLIYGLVLLCGMAALAQLAYTEGRKDSPLPSRSSFSRRPAVRTSRL